MGSSNRLVALFGRILLALPFLVFGVQKAMNFQYTETALAAMKIPMPSVANVVIIVIELLGGLCLVLGFKARLWGWILFLYLIPVTFIFHKFWDLSGTARMVNMAHFLTSLGIMGGLLLLAAFGPGALSADKG